MINFDDLNDKQLLYIDKIKMEPLQEFVIQSLLRYGTKAKLNKAIKVADIVWQRFEHLGYITEYAQQQFVDITIAAALLHNLFYKPNKITSLFKCREKLEDIRESLGIDERLVALVYEIIEGQLGENHPIPKCKPAANSPGSTLADAVWFVNSFKRKV